MEEYYYLNRAVNSFSELSCGQIFSLIFAWLSSKEIKLRRRL
jgi:hypothetical protein